MSTKNIDFDVQRFWMSHSDFYRLKIRILCLLKTINDVILYYTIKPSSFKQKNKIIQQGLFRFGDGRSLSIDLVLADNLPQSKHHSQYIFHSYNFYAVWFLRTRQSGIIMSVPKPSTLFVFLVWLELNIYNIYVCVVAFVVFSKYY